MTAANRSDPKTCVRSRQTGRLRRCWSRLCAALLTAVLGTSVVAAPTSSPVPSPQTARFLDLSARHALVTRYGTVLAQDPFGFIWIGTRFGLSRFDGSEIRAFPIQRSGQPDTDLAANAILSTAEALWVGTVDGLFRLDVGTESFDRVGGTDDAIVLPHQSITALVAGDDGSLWIGTPAGLRRYDTRAKCLDTVAGRARGAEIVSLALAAQGALWVGTGRGLLRLDVATGETKEVALAVGPQRIHSVLAARERGLWVGTGEAGLFKLDGDGRLIGRWQHEPERPASLASNRIWSLLEDRGGRLWVGTEIGVDLKLPGTDFAHFRHRAAQRDSIGGGRINQILEDARGDLWFSTWTSGISLLSPQRAQFNSIRSETVFAGATGATDVMAVRPSGATRVWLPTRNGLLSFDSATDEVEVIDGTQGLRISDVMPFPDDQVLLLAIDTGLARFRVATRQLESITLPAEVGTPFVSSFLRVGDHLWIATRTREVYVLTLALDRVVRRHDLDTRVFDFKRLDADTIMASSTIGAFLFSAGTNDLLDRILAQPHRSDAIPSDSLSSMIRDRGGRVWVSTAAGLHRLERGEIGHWSDGSWRTFRRQGGARHHAMVSVIEDRSGNLWSGAFGGLVRFDPLLESFETFGPAYGTVEQDYFASANALLPDGKLMFASAEGFTVFDPARVRRIERSLQPRITAVELDNRPLRPSRDGILRRNLLTTGTMRFPPGTARNIGLRFAALEYAAPESVRYSYRLVGFDREWNEVDAQRRLANYTNLAPGTYRFEARARLDDAAWGVVTPLTLVIEPHWWQTTTARALGLLALFAAVFGIVRLRLRRLRQARVRLEGEVAERTVQLRHAMAQTESNMADLDAAHRELGAAYARIDTMSRTDPLTGLGNRRSLEQALPAVMARIARGDPGDPRVIAFFLVDIDWFKSVNDTYGHGVGDLVLAMVARVLRREMPAGGLIARWGGEEFLGAVPVGSEIEAWHICDALRRAIAGESLPLAAVREAVRATDSPLPAELRVTASIGLACYFFDARVPERVSWRDVAEIADAALYTAKREGRDRVIGFRTAGAFRDDFAAHLQRAPDNPGLTAHFARIDSIAEPLPRSAIPGRTGGDE